MRLDLLAVSSFPVAAEERTGSDLHATQLCKAEAGTPPHLTQVLHGLKEQVTGLPVEFLEESQQGSNAPQQGHGVAEVAGLRQQSGVRQRLVIAHAGSTACKGRPVGVRIDRRITLSMLRSQTCARQLSRVGAVLAVSNQAQLRASACRLCSAHQQSAAVHGPAPASDPFMRGGARPRFGRWTSDTCCYKWPPAQRQSKCKVAPSCRAQEATGMERAAAAAACSGVAHSGLVILGRGTLRSTILSGRVSCRMSSARSTATSQGVVALHKLPVTLTSRLLSCRCRTALPRPHPSLHAVRWLTVRPAARWRASRHSRSW